MNVRALATDAVVLLGETVLLQERATDPHAGEWVLPGGLVDPGERAVEACRREVREELSLAVDPVAFVGLFDAPDRDPHGNVSVAYLCRPAESAPEPEPNEQASRVERFDPGDLPAMGFDHREIVRAAVTPERR